MIGILFILEILGTIAFSISGAMLAQEKKMDIFGVAILGMTTAVAGGIIRDLIIGEIPPTAFKEPIYAIVAITVAIICFIEPIRNYLIKNNKLISFVDSLGLGIFVAVGTITAINKYPASFFLAIFVGVLTGVGGGVLRDLFAEETPSIFIKDFYATAALIGSIICIILNNALGSNAAMIVCVIVVLVLRIMAKKHNWRLPN